MNSDLVFLNKQAMFVFTLEVLHTIDCSIILACKQP